LRRWIKATLSCSATIAHWPRAQRWRRRCSARELETLAQLYAITLSLGRPAILSDEEVGRIGERLKSNGGDLQARIAALVETKSKRDEPAKTKRVARKRRL
jgi:hypothetical protein